MTVAWIKVFHLFRELDVTRSSHFADEFYVNFSPHFLAFAVRHSHVNAMIVSAIRLLSPGDEIQFDVSVPICQSLFQFGCEFLAARTHARAHAVDAASKAVAMLKIG